ncbi:putative membrane protein [Congregibacter litoralis KT71]|uniref:Putative membrane protein n=1 Tax=Congregibacter litoralis KT71 TaxID=314285 RepID=A4AC18_9GAMM|nr:putative membrane protein [Congregibacter litoralis KT71]
MAIHTFIAVTLLLGILVFWYFFGRRLVMAKSTINEFWSNAAYDAVGIDDRWRCLSAFGREQFKTGGASELVKGWHRNKPLLICAPNTDKFVSVMDSPLTRDLAILSDRRSRKIMIWYFTIVGFFFTSIAGFVSLKLLIPVLIMYLTVIGYLVFSDILAQRQENWLTNRARFVNWISIEATRFLLESALLITLLVLFQGWASAHFGSIDDAVLNIGLVFASIDLSFEGLFRLLIGPFLHSGPAHSIGNFIGIILVLPIAMVYSSGWALCVFVAGTLVGGVVSYYFWSIGSIDLDGFVGVSGGIFALLGWLGAILHKNVRLAPLDISPALVSMAFFLILVSEVINPSAGLAAHLGTLIFGGFLGAIARSVRPFRQT